MKTKFEAMMSVAVAGAVLAVGGAAQAQARPAAGPRLDIAGVGARTSVPEAVATLRKGGWSVTREPGTSWKDAVDGEVQRQRGRMPAWKPVSGEGVVEATKGDERIQIQVRPSPRGGEIESMSYDAPFAGWTTKVHALTDVIGRPYPRRSSLTGAIFISFLRFPRTAAPHASLRRRFRFFVFGCCSART